MFNLVWCWSLLYWMMSLVILYPPDEAVSAGLTIEALFSRWLGSESLTFIQYHIKRTSITLLAHTLLLPGYLIMLQKSSPWIQSYVSDHIHPWAAEISLFISLLPFVIVLTIIWCWKKNNWRGHPIAKMLQMYAPPDITSPNKWVTVASDINNEFRRIDKFSSRVNSVSRILATDSWMIRVTSYKLQALPLRDAIVVLEGSQEASLTHRSGNVGQFLKIRVSSIIPNIKQFWFRIDAAAWTELERKLINPVVNTRQIVIHKSLADRFLMAFNEAVQANPTTMYNEDRDLCIGCMVNVPNVKLERRCEGAIRPVAAGENRLSECTRCSCRPMWCLSCLGKWFAARQDQNNTGTWLSSRAPCPTCRSPFCILDVCVIQNQ